MSTPSPAPYHQLNTMPVEVRMSLLCRCLLPLLALLVVVPRLAAEDAKPVETKPAAATSETKPAEVKADEAKPAEAKPTDAQATDAKPADAQAADAKPADAKPPITDEMITNIRWEEWSADTTFVGPFARDFSRNEEFPERKTDWEDFLAKFAVWAPGHVFDNTEKVRNLICACALMDIGQGQFESELPLFVYQRLRREVPDEKLKAILAHMAFYPNEGAVIETAPELNLDIGVGEDQIRERLQIFAVKMLGRLIGKLPMD